MTMPLRPYPKYKESGIPWVDAIPSAWQKTTLGRITKSKCDGPFGSNLKSSHYTDHGIQVVRLQNIGYAEYRRAVPAFISREHCDTLGDHSVCPGDLLIAGLGDSGHPAGRACVAPDNIEPAIVKADCFRFRLANHLNPQFVAYQLTANAAYDFGILATGSTRQRTNLRSTSSRIILFPSTDEQAAIVRFLDYVGRKIRRFIQAKQRLIEFLSEQKQAIINQAMTRGLNPGTSLKPSGIEWLGDIPENWKLRRFKFLAKINCGQVDPRVAPYCDMTLVAPNHIERSTGRLIKKEPASEQGAISGKYPVSKGQVIYSKIRPSLRKATIAPEDCLCSADMYPISPDETEILTGYILLLLLSEPFTKYAIDCSLRVAMPKINREDLGNCWFWYPSLNEQDAILNYLASELDGRNLAIDRIRSEIDLIREYRTRLIADVVTGKLDVREAAERLPSEVDQVDSEDEPLDFEDAEELDFEEIGAEVEA